MLTGPDIEMVDTAPTPILQDSSSTPSQPPPPPAASAARFETSHYDVTVVDSCPAEEPKAATKQASSEEKTYHPIVLNDRAANRRQPFPNNYARTTKYTLITFIPKLLFEQYKKVTNIYFLTNVVITLIPSLAPISPLTEILPVLFVLGVAAIREAIEDLRRYKSDRLVNNEKFSIYVPKSDPKYASAASATDLIEIRSEAIKVGDVVRLKKNQRVPADIVALKTNSADGLCYLETAQLDGETNLKPYNAHPSVCSKSDQDILNMSGHAKLVVEKPNNNLKAFQGRMTVEEPRHYVAALTEKNILLQGAMLRNTDYVVGVVVYTGKHTKLSLNQRNPPSKFSRCDKVMNFFVLLIFCWKVSMVICMSILAGVYARMSGDHWYLYGNVNSPEPAWSATKLFFSYWSLMSFLIPQSLMVSLEVVKFIQANIMEWDEGMTHEGMGSMMAKTSSLNDELSLVKYVFSDKTGTLTQNKMEYSASSIKGVIYDNKPIADTSSRDITEFFKCLTLCHTVVPEHIDEGEGKPVKIEFQAESPDETALCQAAQTNGFTFWHRTQKQLTVKCRDDSEVKYLLLASIAFTSDRRRMSVIIRDNDGTITLYTKGADNVMLGLVARNTEEEKALHSTISQNLSDFSKTGLRTLVIARKTIPEATFAEWTSDYDNACSMIGDREGAIRTMFEKLEVDMELLGCTAVEDRLQDGVPETIAKLLVAGVQVWMITGDKQETAINISKSCKLVGPNAQLFIADNLTPETAEERLTKLVAEAKARDKVNTVDSALVINGASTNIVVTKYPQLFMEMVKQVDSVVCCQVTPLQKAQIVACVKKTTGEVCLSIGDGANDVTMIQTAHIGIGIFGREGTQAARASDYAIRQFSDLLPLLLVHGRWCMVRSSLLIKFSFYKNVAYFVTQFFFSFFTRFSCQTLYDDWVIMFFNILFTSLPPVAIGIFEKDVPRQLIIEHPEINHGMNTGYMFRIRDIVWWVIYGFYHSILFFFTALGIFYGFANSNQWEVSSYIAFYGLITILLVLVVKRKSWNVWDVLLTIFGFLAFMALWIVESFISGTGKLYWTIPVVFAEADFWLSSFVVVGLGLLPVIVTTYIHTQFRPSLSQVLLERTKLPNQGDHWRKYSL